MIQSQTPKLLGDIIILTHSAYGDIIGRLSEVNDAAVAINKPLRLIPVQHPKTGQPGLMMMPVMPFSPDDTFHYARAHAVCIATPGEHLVKQYLEQISGLTLAGSGTLINESGESGRITL